MEEVIVFTDTNGFIQLRDFKDIPWKELFPKAKRVTITVARTVIEELDRHKVSTNGRRRDRARAALKLIDQASEAPNKTIELRQKPIQVRLSVPRRIRPDWSALPDLDQNAPDDQLVAAALTYGEGAVLLSHDSGPRISAREVGLIACAPPEEWLLPAELSDDQRRIGKLERALEQALASKPKLQIQVLGREEGGTLRLFHPRLDPLSDNAVSRLTDKYLKHNKRARISATQDSMLAIIGGYTSRDVATDNRKFDDFESKVEHFYRTLNYSLSKYRLLPKVPLRVENQGASSATDFHVAMGAEGDFGLVADEKDAAKLFHFPQKPEVPATYDPLSITAYAPHFPDLEAPWLKKESHPTEIEWITRPDVGDDVASYGCKDFRPGRVHEDSVILWPTGGSRSEGTLSLAVGANSLADEALSFPVVIEDRTVAWTDPQVWAVLPEFIREELTGDGK